MPLTIKSILFGSSSYNTFRANFTQIIAEQMERAKRILQENETGHHAIADLLIEKEVITSEDVERILGPRPWKSRGDEIIEANAHLELPAKPKRRSRKKTEEDS